MKSKNLKGVFRELRVMSLVAEGVWGQVPSEVKGRKSLVA